MSFFIRFLRMYLKLLLFDKTVKLLTSYDMSEIWRGNIFADWLIGIVLDSVLDWYFMKCLFFQGSFTVQILCYLIFALFAILQRMKKWLHQVMYVATLNHLKRLDSTNVGGAKWELFQKHGIIFMKGCAAQSLGGLFAISVIM